MTRLGKLTTRKPIVFLRPFEDDRSTSLQPDGLVSAFTGLRREVNFVQSRTKRTGGRISPVGFPGDLPACPTSRMLFDHDVATSEESICRYFGSQGPVIAIGKPGEALPTPGGPRVCTSETTFGRRPSRRNSGGRKQSWSSRGLAAGVRWELEQIHALVEPSRVLFCLAGFWKDPDAYEKLRRSLNEIMQCDFPRVVPFLDRPAFVFFDRDWTPRLQPLSYKCPALWPLTGDAADLKRSLRPFVRGLEGGERQSPLPPRWTGGLGTGLATCAAIMIMLASICVLIIVQSAVSDHLFPKRWVP